MCLFVALPIEEKLQQTINDWCAQYYDWPVNWTKNENLHLTLLAPQEKTADDIDKIINSLKEVIKNTKPFNIDFTNVVPAPRFNPYMIWAVGPTTPEIKKLVNDLKLALPEFKQPREFNLHLTLARFKQTLTPKKIEPINWSIKADKLVLIESILMPEGPIYKTLATINF